MTAIKSAIITLVVSTATAFAEDRVFEIEARYEGFDRSVFAEVNANTKKTPKGILSVPRVTTKAGQTAVIEIVREVVLPITSDGKAPSNATVLYPSTSTNAHGHTITTANGGRTTANCGVSLEVSPEIKDGVIILSGKSTVRHRLKPGTKQPLNAVSFSSRETYFSDQVRNGQTVIIRVGDGPGDKAQITLTIREIAPDGAPIKVSSNGPKRTTTGDDADLVRTSHVTPAVESAPESFDFASHLTPAWINHAGRIDAGKRVIYYTGICARKVTPSPEARLTVEGDVLVIDGDCLVLAPHITCAQDGTGKIITEGESKIIMLNQTDFRMRARVRRLMEPREPDHFVRTILQTLSPELQSR